MNILQLIAEHRYGGTVYDWVAMFFAYMFVICSHIYLYQNRNR